MSQTVEIDPVQLAIAAATKAAAEAVSRQAQDAGAIATMPAANQNLAQMPQRGAPLTMADMSSSLIVDGWLGVKEHGLIVGPGKDLYTDSITVLIDLRSVQVCEAIKFGNPAQYYRTYDRATEARGGSWVDALMRAQRADSKARSYPSADIPMKLTHEIKIKGKVIYDTGATLGNSLSTTNWSNWAKFWRLCADKNLLGTEVKVRVGHEKRTNSNSNVWGVLTFELVA